jgi:RNA polymerase sigma-70 factor (ECF subfamily)
MLNGMTSPDLPSDEQLALRRDVATLYERYARRLLAFLSGLGVPERNLDDLHHDVWIRVFKAFEKRPFEGHFRGWLFKIARNLVMDHKRSPRHDAVALPDAEGGPAVRASPLEGMLRQEEKVILQRCLGRLEQSEAAVFTLRASGASYDEVCEELRLDRKTAYRLSFEATNKLTSCVEQANR